MVFSAAEAEKEKMVRNAITFFIHSVYSCILINYKATKFNVQIRQYEMCKKYVSAGFAL